MLVLRGKYVEDETGVLFEVPPLLIYKLQKITGAETPKELAYLVCSELKLAGLNPKTFTPEQSRLWMAQKYKLLGER